MFRSALSCLAYVYLAMPQVLVLSAGVPWLGVVRQGTGVMAKAPSFQGIDSEAIPTPSAGKGRSNASRAAAVATSGHAVASSLFRRNCSRCHGQDGTGSGHRDRWLHLPDFTSTTWHETRSTHDLLVSIRDGKGSHMPPFGDRLNEKQLGDLVALVRAFADLPQGQQTPNTSANFEKRYRELRKEWADLRSEFQKLSAQLGDD
jgi:mono/diheme cytochrome c family protein